MSCNKQQINYARDFQDSILNDKYIVPLAQWEQLSKYSMKSYQRQFTIVDTEASSPRQKSEKSSDKGDSASSLNSQKDPKEAVIKKKSFVSSLLERIIC